MSKNLRPLLSNKKITDDSGHCENIFVIFFNAVYNCAVPVELLNIDNNDENTQKGHLVPDFWLLSVQVLAPSHQDPCSNSLSFINSI